jgi:hypothetical protein
VYSFSSGDEAAVDPILGTEHGGTEAALVASWLMLTKDRRERSQYRPSRTGGQYDYARDDEMVLVDFLGCAGGNNNKIKLPNKAIAFHNGQ